MVRLSVPLGIPVKGVRNDLDYIGDQSTLGGRALGANMLSQAENWVYRDGIFTLRRGTEAYGTGGAGRPMGYIQYAHTDGALRTVCGTAGGWRKFNAGTANWDDITGSALTSTGVDQIVFRVFQKSGTSYLIGLNNGTNTMKKWDGTAGTYSDAAGSPPKARTMMVVGGRLILLSLLSGGTISNEAFDVSAFNDFEAGWGTVLTGLLADTPGDIIAALEMGDLQGAVYKTDSIYVFTASAGTAPYEIHLKAVGIPGPIAPNALFALPDGTHVWLATDGTIRRFDGVSVTTVGLNQGRNVQKYFNRVTAAQQANLNRSFGYYNSRENELWFHFCSGASSPDMALCVKMESGALWPMRWATMRFSAGMFGKDMYLGANVPQAFLGEIGGSQYRETQYVDFTTKMTDNASAIVSFWQTGMLDPSASGTVQPGTWVTVGEIDHVLAGAAAASATTSQLRFKVFAESYGSFGNVADAGMVVDPRSVGPYITGHRVSGRAFAIRCDATTDCNNIQWRGATLTFAKRGER